MQMKTSIYYRTVSYTHLDVYKRQINGSKARLHTDVMDIYWIHNPFDVEKWTPDLIPLAKSGQIKEIGVSNHNLAQIKRANEILAKEGLRVSACLLYTSIWTRNTEFLIT